MPLFRPRPEPSVQLYYHVLLRGWVAGLGRYMEKLAVGPRVNPHMVSLLYPIERNLRAVAAALEKPLGCA